MPLTYAQGLVDSPKAGRGYILCGKMLKMNPHVLGQGLIILAQAEAVKVHF